MQNTSEKIKNIIEILEEACLLEAKNLERKCKNLKDINIETLTRLVDEETEKGNIKQDRVIVKYIERIVQNH